MSLVRKSLSLLTAIPLLWALPALADPPATPAPSPKATSGPNTFSWNGYSRAYYFARTNGNSCLESTCSPKGTPDSRAFNIGFKLHGQYTITKYAMTLGATYFAAEPFGANPSGLLGVGYNPQVDNTLPGYALSTLAEMYAQYKTSGFDLQTGKQVINTPWANAADSRLVPITFQGTLADVNISPSLKLGAMDMVRFKSRVTSAFDADTLLTSCVTANPTGKGPIAGIPGTFTVEGDQCNTQQTTSGFLLFSAQFNAHGLSASAYQYHMYDLVNLTYVDAKYEYAPNSPLKPFVAAQVWSDNDTGRALIGTVHSQGSGFQFGVTLFPNIDLAASYNQVPYVRYVVPKASCPGDAASPTAASAGTIFGGVQDTSDKSVPSGDIVCYGGGVASPYTDNYESDPLYTSSIGEGIIDARKGGYSAKIALTLHTNDRRLTAILSQARYNVSLPGTSDKGDNTDIRTEGNLDVQYFFNAVDPKRPYHGLSIRERLVERSQTFTPFVFKYNRTQIEFAF